MLLLESPSRVPAGDAHDDTRLCTRICAEYREMPGLVLTLPQAARLFSIELPRCERVLRALVDQGYLLTNGTTYASARGGRP